MSNSGYSYSFEEPEEFDLEAELELDQQYAQYSDEFEHNSHQQNFGSGYDQIDIHNSLSVSSQINLHGSSSKRKLFPVVDLSEDLAVLSSQNELTQTMHELKENNKKLKSDSTASSALVQSCAGFFSSSDFNDSHIYVFSREPLHTGSISITTNSSTGERFFLLLESESIYRNRIKQQQIHTSTMYQSVQTNNSTHSTRHRKIKNLLSQPIQSLLRSVEEKEIQKATVKSLQLKRQNELKQKLILDLSNPNASKQSSVITKNASTCHQLWVDKYAPKSFTDLLSSERLNREILSWIKEWDEIVFNKKKNQHQIDKHEGSKSKMFHSKYTSGVVTSDRTNTQDNSSTVNVLDTRPEQKILLLCGPAGRSKTSMAHILAATAGYRTVEINASDDRTEQELCIKIRSAVENTSVLPALNRHRHDNKSIANNNTQSTRPNLLILDEIDGVASSSSSDSSSSNSDKTAIQTLVKIVNAQPKQTNAGKKSTYHTMNSDETVEDDVEDETEESDSAAANNDSSLKKSRYGKKKESFPVLRRPIIAICNDQFAPVLRPLRAISKIFVFDKPNKQRLIDRLKYICKKEKLLADENFLNVLVDLVELDIRQAINTLQFLHQKQMEYSNGINQSSSSNAVSVSVELLHSLQIGLKDVSKSRFEVMENILNNKVLAQNLIQRQVGGVGNNKINSESTSSHGTSSSVNSATNTLIFTSLWNIVDDQDSSKIIDLLHSNYLNLNYSDPTFQKTIATTELFSYCDTQSQSGIGSGELNFLPYEPLLAVHTYYHLSKPNKTKVTTSSQFQYHQLQTQANNILNSFLQNNLFTTSSKNDMNFYTTANTLRLLSLSARQLVVECLSSLLDIISPPLRPNNLALLAPNERDEFDSLIDNLISLTLNFKIDTSQMILANNFNSHNTMNGGNNYIVRLEPPVDTLCQFHIQQDSDRLIQSTALLNRHLIFHSNLITSNFANHNAPNYNSNHRELPNKLKQMISRELEFELVRRFEAKKLKQNEVLNQNNSNEQSSTISTSFQPVAPVKSLPLLLSPSSLLDPKRKTNFLQEMSNKLKSSSMNRVRAQAAKQNSNSNQNHLYQSVNSQNLDTTNSFANISSNLCDQPLSSVSSQCKFHFKFNEGFTQAVRRTITVSHFT